MSHPEAHGNGANVDAEPDAESTVVTDIITRLDRQGERIDSPEAELEQEAAEIEALQTLDQQATPSSSRLRSMDPMSSSTPVGPGVP
jgi:hypothetical protein